MTTHWGVIRGRACSLQMKRREYDVLSCTKQNLDKFLACQLVAKKQTGWSSNWRSKQFKRNLNFGEKDVRRLS